MSGGFFRGTSAEQDTRFSNKTAKLLKTQKFAPELDQLVDMSKVKMDAIRPWIATRVTQLLGFEDEVLINFIYGLLEGKEVDGKQIQIQLTGFMEKNTGKFMRELWNLLTSAQNNISGIPQQFLDEKAEEARKKKAEDQRIVSEFRKKEEDKKDAEIQRSDMHNVSSEATRTAVPVAVKSTSSRSPRGFSGGRSPDGVHGRAKNGVPKRNGSGDVSPVAMRHGKDRRRSHSRSISGSILSSRSVSRSPHLHKRRVSRSASRSPKRMRRSRTPPRHGRAPIINRSPRRRRSRSPPRRPVPWSPPRSRRRSPGYPRLSPRRRPRPSPSPRRCQAPSLSPSPSPRRRPRPRPSPSLSPRRRARLSPSPTPRRRQIPSLSPRDRSPKKILIQSPTSLSKERKDFHNRSESRREENHQFSQSDLVDNLGVKKPMSPPESSFSLEKKQAVVKRADGFDANASTSGAIKHGAKPLEPVRLVSKASDDNHGKDHMGNWNSKMESDEEEDGDMASPTTSTDEMRKAAKKRRKDEKRLRKEERRRKREEKQRRKEERRAAKAAAKAIPSVTPPPDLENNTLVELECFDSVQKLKKSEDDEMENEQRRLENELRKKALDSIRAKKAVNS